MTVHPGFGGQHFMDEVLGKVRRVADELRRRASSALVEVDGGIDEHTIEATAAAGARMFVCGTAVFGTDDPASAVASLRQAAAAACE
jgi:ribulose-phosphate 3-epimerase